MFIQVIQGKVADADGLRAAVERWQDTVAPAVTGWLGTTGGVTPETVPELASAGARRFVVVRWLTEAADPQRAARDLADAIERALATRPPDVPSSR